MIANKRGDERLRRHRVSIPQTSYFLTICTIDRTPILLRSGVANCIRNEIRTIETTGHWHCRAGVIMPDHIHLLVRMTGVLPVGRCVARLKAKTNSWLHAADTRWQRNFYEHRLRPDDSVEEILRYIFLNPHREYLVADRETYPWCWFGAEEEAWFMPLTDEGRPFPAWLK